DFALGKALLRDRGMTECQGIDLSKTTLRWVHGPILGHLDIGERQYRVLRTARCGDGYRARGELLFLVDRLGQKLGNRIRFQTDLDGVVVAGRGEAGEGDRTEAAQLKHHSGACRHQAGQVLDHYAVFFLRTHELSHWNRYSAKASVNRLRDNLNSGPVTTAAE